MPIIAHPRWAPPGRLRIWVGLITDEPNPTLVWTLNEQATNPTSLQPLSKARPAHLHDGKGKPVLAGVFEFAGLSAGTYRVRLSAGTESYGPFQVRSFPDGLPAQLDTWFNVLLVSCYHYVESPRGVLETTIEEILRERRPDLAILMGDQVYLDLPTAENFPRDARWLARKFEQDYVRNWFGPEGYARVLGAAPSISIPDDHEYWNNYPHRSPVIQNSWDAAGRAQWRSAAEALYRSFQMPVPGSLGDAHVIDVPPLSIFIADSRSERQDDLSRVFPTKTIRDLKKWVTRLNRDGHFGLFVTGQSLFDGAASRISGAIGDRTLANYRDYDSVVQTLSQLKKPLFCATGDVHWGRVARVTHQGRENRIAMYEIITSPSALVSTIVKDQAKKIKAALGGLFGTRNPWPRHSEASAVSDVFPEEKPLPGLRCAADHAQVGDQVSVLSFRRHGDGIKAQVCYYPVHGDPVVRFRQKSTVELDVAADIA